MRKFVYLSLFCILFFVFSACSAVEVKNESEQSVDLFPPYLLDLIGKTHAEWENEHPFTEQDDLLLTEQANVFDRFFSISVSIDRAGTDIIGGYSYFLDTDGMNKEESYDLLCKIFDCITESYGEPLTYPSDMQFTKVQSAEELPQMAYERWLVPGEWKYPMEIPEKVSPEDFYFQLELRYEERGDNSAPRISMIYSYIYHPLQELEIESGIKL